MQTLFNLDGGYAVKLTTAKWYTPVGRSIQKERKLLPDGRFVEVYPDSLPEDSLKKIRPEYKSDAGRTVYGGGAITPDLVVQPDTLTTPEQELARALTSKFTAKSDRSLSPFSPQSRSSSRVAKVSALRCLGQTARRQR